VRPSSLEKKEEMQGYSVDSAVVVPYATKEAEYMEQIQPTTELIQEVNAIRDDQLEISAFDRFRLINEGIYNQQNEAGMNGQPAYNPAFQDLTVEDEIGQTSHGWSGSNPR
jgi:hypothetical protein